MEKGKGTGLKILIAVGGNNFSRETLEPAVRFARKAKAQIQLLSVITKDHSYITWKREYIPEGASHHFLDVSNSLPQTLVDGPAHPDMVETRDQALEREVTFVEDRLSNVGRDIIEDQVEARVLVDSHFQEAVESYATREAFDMVLLPPSEANGRLASVSKLLHRKRPQEILTVVGAQIPIGT